jgi:hypothetical protein
MVKNWIENGRVIDTDDIAFKATAYTAPLGGVERMYDRFMDTGDLLFMEFLFNRPTIMIEKSSGRDEEIPRDEMDRTDKLVIGKVASVDRKAWKDYIKIERRMARKKAGLEKKYEEERIRSWKDDRFKYNKDDDYETMRRKNEERELFLKESRKRVFKPMTGLSEKALKLYMKTADLHKMERRMGKLEGKNYTEFKQWFDMDGEEIVEASYKKYLRGTFNQDKINLLYFNDEMNGLLRENKKRMKKVREMEGKNRRLEELENRLEKERKNMDSGEIKNLISRK